MVGLTLPPTEGSPGTISVKVLPKAHSQGTKWRRNIAENFNPLSRAHERYRRPGASIPLEAMVHPPPQDGRMGPPIFDYNAP